MGPDTEPSLRAEGVHKRFGGVHALRGADLAVYASEVHGLTGENGSGKSTLLKILGGQLQPDAGRIELAGVATSFRSAREGMRKGVVTVSQETTLAPDLSVAENIFLGHRMARRSGVIDWKTTRHRAQAALARLGLDLDPGLPARRLRPDQAQMVEIARALSMEARVLILDEPTSSLTDDAVAVLFESVRRVCAAGVATIFVSHRLDELFALCDRVTTLRDGITVGTGPIGDYDRESLVSLMVGSSLERSTSERPEPATDGVLLRVRGLSLPGAFAEVDLDVHRGEIVGLAGLVGAGRTELLESLFGLHRTTAGSVEVEAQPRSHRTPREAIRDGIALVPADRKGQGLVLGRSFGENLLMASQSRVFRLRRPRRKRDLATVEAATSRLLIRAASPDVAAGTLSGGNQQKVLLGKWLETNPRLLMLDEPTRGVDVRAKSEIYRLLVEARSRGVAILVASSETPELLSLCDRILVMFRGRVVGSLTREEADETAVARLAAGHA